MDHLQNKALFFAIAVLACSTRTKSILSCIHSETHSQPCGIRH
ncbi:hypothetical protein ACIN8IBEIGE_160232 [Acinetobacter sp. 8I-beige]|nr:hypothetical protein ACIN8IBEIGE_160232 [Acinetobacter sp. 8I-beige]